MTAPRDLTIGVATDRMRKGELTARELAESCLERIHARDNTIRAWVEAYAKQAIEEARRCDRDAQAGKWRGDLHGIPVGVKDIIDVQMAALPMAEAHLLSVAAWCEQVLAFDHRPLPDNGAAE